MRPASPPIEKKILAGFGCILVVSIAVSLLTYVLNGGSTQTGTNLALLIVGCVCVVALVGLAWYLARIAGEARRQADDTRREMEDFKSRLHESSAERQAAEEKSSA